MKEKYLLLDCLGDFCPVPLMKLKQHEKDLENGDGIEMVTDHSCVSESVTNYCKVKGYALEILEPVNGVWEIYIHKVL